MLGLNDKHLDECKKFFKYLPPIMWDDLDEQYNATVRFDEGNKVFNASLGIEKETLK